MSFFKNDDGIYENLCDRCCMGCKETQKPKETRCADACVFKVIADPTYVSCTECEYDKFKRR